MSTATLSRAVRAEKHAYAKDAEVPAGTYAGLTAGYVALLGAGAAAVAARRKHLPDRVGARDIALLGVATYKLSRLVSQDKVTSFLRMPVTEYVSPSSASEVDERPRGTGWRRGVGELVTCPWCTAQWVATGLGFAQVLAPRATRYVSSVLAALVVADGLHYAQAAVADRVDS